MGKNQNQKACPPRFFAEKSGRAWVVSVDMGYGHQRTAYPLRSLAPEGKVINANSYQWIPEKDRKIWESSRKFYEFISNLKRFPLIGETAFAIFDKFQEIPTFYPKRDLSKPTLTLKRIYSLIKKGWGKGLIETLRLGSGQDSLPLITTFFIPAFMAEVFDYPGEIFCVICDADISRSWVALEPKKSRIKYFAPNSWSENRLKLYGVKTENIFLTGYPLPLENIGGEQMEILKEDLGYRLLNLDPQKRYCQEYKPLIEKYLGKLPENPDHCLTIMFSIGGAGAQKEIAMKVLKSLAEEIRAGKVKMILSAGIRENVKNYFEREIVRGRASDKLWNNVEILYRERIEDYFDEFNQKLRKTDILWTKPSELSFYAALGLPIIVAPSMGSQEDFNRKWLLSLGAGTLQENPNYTNQWLFDYLESGRFAEAAMDGFIEAEKLGVYNIGKAMRHS